MTGTSKWRAGQTFELVTSPVTTMQLVKYAGASDDYNRIHYDEPFAKAAGLGGVIAHGMLTMAFMGRAVTDWIGPKGEVKQLAARFTSPVRPGDEVRVSGKVLESSESPEGATLKAEITAHVGDRTVATGSASVRIRAE